MAPPLRPPNRTEPLPFPVFGMSWYADPSDGRSVLAYCGGGGSAKTGVGNSVTILENDQPRRVISTGYVLGLDVDLYRNPVSGKLWLAVVMDNANEVRRYRMPEGVLDGVVQVGEPCSKIAVNVMADLLAVGCDGGNVLVYSISDDRFDERGLIFKSETHTKAVSQMAFSLRGGRMITASKDGNACIYENGKVITAFKCSARDDSVPPPKIKPTVMVRGCAFLDMEGREAVTVASAKRGKAFIARWAQERDGFRCVDRIPCSPCPISCIDLSQDGSMLSLGAADGSVILWSVEKWQPIKTFRELHEFPVTCIATRPFPVPLQGEDDGVRIDVRTASGDGKMGCLTTQRRAPKQASGGPGKPTSIVGTMETVNKLIILCLLAWMLSPVWHEATVKCANTRGRSWWRCFKDDVLIAPADRPGILVPPY